MKRAVIIAIAGVAAWQWYQDSTASGVFAVQSSSAAAMPPAGAVRFRCDGREHCSQMTSRPEAEFFTSNCPNAKMDGDNDGEPCENDSRF